MAKKRLHKSLHIYFSKLKRTPPTHRNYLNAPPFPAADRGATLSDVDRCLSESFSSLHYGNNDVITGPTDFSPRFTDPPPHVIKASKRFFVAPGPTGSLIEEARLSAASSRTSTASAGDSTPVVTVSVNPYVDFRQSMQEMVDARHVDPSGPLDWGFLEDLLACYLELNERSVHECILRAFMDLTEGLRRQNTEVIRYGKMV